MLDNLTKKQKIVVYIIAVIVAIGMIYFIYNNNQVKNDDVEKDILVSNTSTKEEEKNEQEQIVVHVTGSVKSPGIVKLKDGSRIEDAIEAAGGLTENADISKVNLAYVLEDGIKIKIPSSSEEDIGDGDVLIDGSGENVVEEDDSQSTNQNGKGININKADETELQTLPGIGASLASRIVEYRKQNGKFANIEDIKNVSGIGDSKFSNIKDLITVK